MLELDARTLTYDEFRDRCLAPNVPAIIRNAGSSSFHLDALLARLSPGGLCGLLGPQHAVPVYHVHDIQPTTVEQASPSAPSSSSTADRRGSGQGADYECEEKPLEEVLLSWRHGSAQAERLYYLKDWHMQTDVEQALHREGAAAAAATTTRCSSRQPTSARRHGCSLYEVPEYLGPDWMDPFCVDVCAGALSGSGSGASPLVGFGDAKHDYRFAYVGAPSTWTVLHHDVFGTYSWSLNVCGEKLWFFPDAAGNRFLLDTLVRGLPTPPDIRVLTGVTYLTCLQRPGDLVFVPSRYYHQVHNTSGRSFTFQPSGAHEPAATMDLIISVNHNWCNQFCIESMVNIFLDDVGTVQRLVDAADLAIILGPDDREAWCDHVDMMLQGGSNWSFGSMLSFLEYCRCEFGAADQEDSVGTLLSVLVGKVSGKRRAMFS